MPIVYVLSVAAFMLQLAQLGSWDNDCMDLEAESVFCVTLYKKVCWPLGYRSSKTLTK